LFCHSREGGNPDNLLFLLDSRLRGNDKKGLISRKTVVFGQTLNNASAEVTVDPMGFAVALEADDIAEVEVTLENDGDNDVIFGVDFDSPPEEEERGRGPRRDQPEGRGILIHNAITGWGNFQLEPYFEAIDGLEYDRFRQWNDVEDVDFDDYDFMWIGNYEPEAWVAQYNQNLERIEEFVDGGGALYRPSGTNLHNTRPINPGGLVYNGSQSQNQCPLQLDPEENFLINYMNENDPFNWEWGEGQRLVGSGCAHGIFLQDDIDDMENVDWVQIMAMGNPANEPIILTYQFGRGFCLVSTTVDGFLHNNPQAYHWGRTGEAVIWYLDFLAAPKWIAAEPDEGVIEADDSEVITITLEPGDMEEGAYEMRVLFELEEAEDDRDDLEENLIEVSVVMTVDASTYSVEGVVTDPANDEVVEGVTIQMDRYMLTRYSNGDGEYSFEDLPAGEYEFTFTAPDFLPTIEGIEIEEDDIELDVALLHSECTPSDEEFFMALNPDFDHVFELEIVNGGNGPLVYRVERCLLGDADADPWELREVQNTEETADDNQVNGVVFAADHYFISGGNRREDDNKIYVFNREGELIREFDQFHQSDYGMRDLCWDGELIWGSDDGILYGFDTEGELVHEIEGEADSYRSLTYDRENELFISADITSDIYISDREGHLTRTINRPGDLRTYGLAYWPDDPDGYNLYAFGRGEETDLSVSKVNLENGDLSLVAEIDEVSGRPGGICITNTLDIYSWVFIGVAQNPDRIAVWQLEGRREWFQIEPEAGEIGADDSENFILTLDATDLPPDNTFNGILVFHHDGIGGQTEISVRLDVVEGEVHTTRELDLLLGWNTVSVNLQPDEEDVEVLMADLVEEDLLEMMKDGAGHFYRPDYNFNNIPGWSVEQGYQVKMRQAAQLTLEGWTVVRDEPIALEEGWQLVSYYPTFPIDATLALSGIEDNLIICKDGFGNFYIPAWDYSNIGDMLQGQGYYMNVDEDVELIYVFEREDALFNDDIWHQTSIYNEPSTLPTLQPTGSNMSLLVLADPSLTADVAVYSSDMLIGSGVLQDGYCGIAVWGDDPTTAVIDGAVQDEPFETKLFSNTELQTVDLEALSGTATYLTNSLTVIRLITSSVELPDEFGITSAYPNPFNSRMNVSFGLPEAADVRLDVFDLAGRYIAELTSGRHQAGIHTTVFDGSNLASGVYVICFEAGGITSQWKVALVK
ncbi:MAG: carboxypeptidase regulatory-like domain-containing protein, partial [Candidatus Hatepunaea meridiana]|nr:carboxypeptidase regulatory-like domain-containing protein [Candidatus Hatepunaea meridiana]